tara:strand:+ start:3912 stop:4646 length:735 start_codon:yes stop_codon:yes gene_type:complete
MYKDKSIIAIIPARSGSVGLKNKNILKLKDKPLVSWPIMAAKKSAYIDSIIVSTDSKKIAKIAKKHGIDTPFLRPKKLSGNKATTIEVMDHVIKYLNNESISCDYIIVLEPTSPFTNSNDIDKCIENLYKKRNSFDSLVGVCRNDKYHPNFSLYTDKNNKVKNIQSSLSKHTRRQDCTEILYPDGSIYITTKSSFIKNKTFYHSRTLGYKFPKWKSIEIDDEIDFITAQKLATKIKYLEKKYNE